MTSRPAHLVLYKKHDCQPCSIAYENLEYVLNLSPELEQYVTVIQKEDQPELVQENDLTLYPTVLILDDDQKVISRKVGVRYLTTHWWHSALTSIHLRTAK